MHVVAWIEELGCEASAPTVKQRLAAIRHLFDWLVVGQIGFSPRPELVPGSRAVERLTRILAPFSKALVA